MSETRTVRLGSLIKPAGKRAGENSNLPVYSVTKHQGFVPSLEYFKKQVFSRETKSYKVVEQGQFAYATIHRDEGSIGIAPEKCIISPMYTVFEVTSEEVIPEYLLLYLKGPRAMATYPLLGQGAIERRMTISLKSLSTLEIPLPPLEQQEREVKSFHLQTTITKKRERQQELFIEFERAIFNQKYTKATKSVKLGDIVEIRSGLVDPTLPEYQDLPHIGPDSIVSGSDEIIGWRTAAEDGVKSGKFLFKKGDILYSKIRPNLNKVAIAQFDGLCSADMYPLITRSDLVDAKYIQMVLSSQEFIAYANSLSNRANIPKLNKNQLLNYTLKI